jgi:hypothetical protein
MRLRRFAASAKLKPAATSRAQLPHSRSYFLITRSYAYFLSIRSLIGWRRGSESNRRIKALQTF